MPEYLAPAVYVEETDTGAKPIEGVSTSTAGMVGVTERGPANWPILITSYGDYRRWFGEPLDPDPGAFGEHCMLPHAVEGFFTNGGKRVYVARVEHPRATRATVDLFDRAQPATVTSRLLRAAARASGTAVQLPRIYVLDPATFVAGAPPTWLRIGDGSPAEYRAVAVQVGVPTHVALNMPLDFGHATGTAIVEHTVAGAPVNLNPTQPGAAGSNVLVLNGGVAANSILEIRGAEHYLVTAAAQVGAGPDTRVTLNVGLRADVGPATQVSVLNLAAGGATVLETQANPGESVIFGANLGGNFPAGSVVVIDPAPGVGVTEVRAISTLADVTITPPAPQLDPQGSLIEHVNVADDVRTINAPPATVSGDVLHLDDVQGLVPGQRVIIAAGNNNPAETLAIRTVDTGTSTVTLAAPLAADHGAPPVVLVPESKTVVDLAGRPAPAGTHTLRLSDRLGLQAGDVVVVNAGGPTEEFLIIARIAGDPVQPGDVTFEQPTAYAHAAGTTVARQIVAAVAGAAPAYAALPILAGGERLILGDLAGLAATNLVRVRTPVGAQFYHRVVAVGAALAPRAIELNAPLARDHEAGAVVTDRQQVLRVEALDTGAWGNRLRISVRDERDETSGENNGLVNGACITGLINPTQVVLASTGGVEPGTVLELRDHTGRIGSLLKVTAVNRMNGRVTLDAATPLNGVQQGVIGANPPDLVVNSLEFRLTVLLLAPNDPLIPSRDDTILDSESFSNLSMDPRHSRYVVDVLGAIGGERRAADNRPEGASWFVRTSDSQTAAVQHTIRLGPEALTDQPPSGRPPTAARLALSEGDDAIPQLTSADFVGHDNANPERRTGLQALTNIEDVSLVAIPGNLDQPVQDALIAHCEMMKYRFAVLDGPRPPDDEIANAQAQRQRYDTKYAALYHPWLQIPHPFPVIPAQVGQPYAIPPSGHVLGVYARTDIDRGVHKAPANEVVRGILGLQRVLNKREQDILNPSPVNINVIRDFRTNERGIRIWGGRVITSDSDWKYVNVRRLLIFIEHSLDRGLQWVVFEPNAEPLWARVRRAITNFLRVVWRNGGLEGTKVEEAFFVKCDRTTMTQTEIDNGQLICVIGVAPVKPAEFVIIRIGLWTARSD